MRTTGRTQQRRDQSVQPLGSAPIYVCAILTAIVLALSERSIHFLWNIPLLGYVPISNMVYPIFEFLLFRVIITIASRAVVNRSIMSPDIFYDILIPPSSQRILLFGVYLCMVAHSNISFIFWAINVFFECIASINLFDSPGYTFVVWSIGHLSNVILTIVFLALIVCVGTPPQMWSTSGLSRSISAILVPLVISNAIVSIMSDVYLSYTWVIVPVLYLSAFVNHASLFIGLNPRWTAGEKRAYNLKRAMIMGLFIVLRKTIVMHDIVILELWVLGVYVCTAFSDGEMSFLWMSMLHLLPHVIYIGYHITIATIGWILSYEAIKRTFPFVRKVLDTTETVLFLKDAVTSDGMPVPRSVSFFIDSLHDAPSVKQQYSSGVMYSHLWWSFGHFIVWFGMIGLIRLHGYPVAKTYLGYTFALFSAIVFVVVMYYLDILTNGIDTIMSAGKEAISMGATGGGFTLGMTYIGAKYLAPEARQYDCTHKTTDHGVSRPPPIVINMTAPNNTPIVTNGYDVPLSPQSSLSSSSSVVPSRWTMLYADGIQHVTRWVSIVTIAIQQMCADFLSILSRPSVARVAPVTSGYVHPTQGRTTLEHLLAYMSRQYHTFGFLVMLCMVSMMADVTTHKTMVEECVQYANTQSASLLDSQQILRDDVCRHVSNTAMRDVNLDILNASRYMEINPHIDGTMTVVRDNMRILQLVIDGKIIDTLDYTALQCIVVAIYDNSLALPGPVSCVVTDDTYITAANHIRQHYEDVGRVIVGGILYRFIQQHVPADVYAVDIGMPPGQSKRLLYGLSVLPPYDSSVQDRYGFYDMLFDHLLKNKLQPRSWASWFGFAPDDWFHMMLGAVPTDDTIVYCRVAALPFLVVQNNTVSVTLTVTSYVRYTSQYCPITISYLEGKTISKAADHAVQKNLSQTYVAGFVNEIIALSFRDGGFNWRIVPNRKLYRQPYSDESACSTLRAYGYAILAGRMTMTKEPTVPAAHVIVKYESNTFTCRPYQYEAADKTYAIKSGYTACDVRCQSPRTGRTGSDIVYKENQFPLVRKILDYADPLNRTAYLDAISVLSESFNTAWGGAACEKISLNYALDSVLNALISYDIQQDQYHPITSLRVKRALPALEGCHPTHDCCIDNNNPPSSIKEAIQNNECLSQMTKQSGDFYMAFVRCNLENINTPEMV